MIGFYNYTVILTFASLISAILGMTFAINGHIRLAMVCLALSGFFDMFDGKVARRKKDRTDNEKLFGIQLDSLCDAVAFGVLPVVICYCMGIRGTLGMFAICFYAVCGIMRLSYFNVLETNKFFSEDTSEKIFHGLPITSSSVIFPLIFLLNFVLPTRIFYLILTISLYIVGALFIADFKLKKPSNKLLTVLVIIVAAAILFAFWYQKYRMIHPPMYL